MRFLLVNGTVVDGGTEIAADVAIEDRAIEAVGKGLAGKSKDSEVTRLNCTGCVILPGLVDMHVHLREPGREDEETVASGALAALAGGFTDVAAMANTSPVADTGAVVEFVGRQAGIAGAARVHPVGAITKRLAGEELAEMGDMADAGAVAFSDDGTTPASALIMRRALEYAKSLGRPVLAHCLDPALTSGGAMNEGIVATRLGLEGIPDAAEEVIVAREIALAEMVGSPVHIQHISTAAAVVLVREAKDRGAPVTCEVTPHHLFLEDSACEGYDPVYKVNPPLRTSSDREALARGLADGTIDCVASDHAPHATHEKELEFECAPFGLVGLETTVPLVVERLVKNGGLSWSRMAEVLSGAPRRILGLPEVRISVGAPADITVIDPDVVRTVGEHWHSKSRNCPWWGIQLAGHARHVIVAGEALLVDGVLDSRFGS